MSTLLGKGKKDHKSSELGYFFHSILPSDKPSWKHRQRNQKLRIAYSKTLQSLSDLKALHTFDCPNTEYNTSS